MPTAPKTLEQLIGRTRQTERDREQRRADRRKIYNSPEWQRLRQVVLDEEPACMACHQERSTEVDHINPLAKCPDLALVRKNLQGLCAACHAKKTARGA